MAVSQFQKNRKLTIYVVFWDPHIPHAGLPKEKEPGYITQKFVHQPALARALSHLYSPKNPEDQQHHPSHSLASFHCSSSYMSLHPGTTCQLKYNKMEAFNVTVGHHQHQWQLTKSSGEVKLMADYPHRELKQLPPSLPPKTTMTIMMTSLTLS